jgi:hypothetical protein
LLVEHGARHLGGVHAAYDLPEDEYVDLVAHLLTRNAEDGWRNTLAPSSPVDAVNMHNERHKPASKPTTDPALAAFADWASR